MVNPGLLQAIQDKYAQVQEESLPYMEQDDLMCHEVWRTETRNLRRCSPDISISIPVIPVHGNTTAEYFQVGDDMFPVLVRELEQAQHYIYIEYFIINDGVMWRTILDILERKAIRGRGCPSDL